MQHRKIREFILTIGMVLAALMPATACTGGCPGNGCADAASVTFAVPDSSISADTLAGLLKSGVPLQLVEYRARRQTREISIPGAVVIYDDTPPASFAAVLDASGSLKIVYPGIEGSKLASFVTELRDLGYQSIIEYPAGLHGWLTYGYQAVEPPR